MHTTTIIDDEDDGPPRLAGGKFYMTPEGHALLTAELHQLRAIERPYHFRDVHATSGPLRVR